LEKEPELHIAQRKSSTLTFPTPEEENLGLKKTIPTAYWNAGVLSKRYLRRYTNSGPVGNQERRRLSIKFTNRENESISSGASRSLKQKRKVRIKGEGRLSFRGRKLKAHHQRSSLNSTGFKRRHTSICNILGDRGGGLVRKYTAPLLSGKHDTGRSTDTERELMGGIHESPRGKISQQPPRITNQRKTGAKVHRRQGRANESSPEIAVWPVRRAGSPEVPKINGRRRDQGKQTGDGTHTKPIDHVRGKLQIITTKRKR